MSECTKPKRVKPRIKSAPKVGQFYWCDFPEDAQLPEFWKCRPVIVVSYKNTLHGTVTVVPCTTLEPQERYARMSRWSFPLGTSIDGRQSWAICDKVTCVAVSRLSIHQGQIPRLCDDEFNMLLACVLDWLPKVR